MTTPDRPRVVIVGAGFGGLWAARALAHSPVDVLLVDRNNYHTFFPLLYQVAAAELEPEEIAYPVRAILASRPHQQFAMATIRGIDFARRTLENDGPPIPYDYLILAPGSVSHFFGIPGVAEYSFPLKTVDQGIALRNRFLANGLARAHQSGGALKLLEREDAQGVAHQHRDAAHSRISTNFTLQSPQSHRESS